MKMLRPLRKAKGLTMKELGDIIGVAESTISQYETGKRSPDFETMLKLGEYFDVSVDYLLRGDVYTGQLEKRSPLVEGIDYIRVPVLGRVAAGVPIETIEEVEDWEDLKIEMTAGGKEYFGLKVKGDSMYPKFLDGDTVIVQKAVDCESGDICVVYINGYDATLKQVKKEENGDLTLIPTNPEYAPKTYTKEETTSLPVAVCGIVRELRRTV